MSKVKHTPGPWQVETDPFHYDTASTVVGGQRVKAKGISHQMLVQVGGWASPTEQEANARLIAAAPDNYACNVELAAIVREMCGVFKVPLPQASLDRSDAAIAKATIGETP